MGWPGGGSNDRVSGSPSHSTQVSLLPLSLCIDKAAGPSLADTRVRPPGMTL